MNKKSGHWQNTGLAKWISDNLYQYNTSDEKSMNPMKWHSINNGGNLSDTRETINGFPCRLILINDGETPLNEGQNEPTPGNVKDMGIFNFNNDKGNTDTFGLDNKIFPQCASYEVVANSDTSAGAFVPCPPNEAYFTNYSTDSNGKNYATGGTEISKFINSEGKMIITVNCNSTSGVYMRTYGADNKFIGIYNLTYSDGQYKGTFTPNDTAYTFDVGVNSVSTNEVLTGNVIINNMSFTIKVSPSKKPFSDYTDELAYLQDSFELRYPDDKEVGADYGMLGMDIDNSGTLNSEYGLKRVIDWVGNATDEEFVRDFEQYFNKEYTFRYYLLVITLG